MYMAQLSKIKTLNILLMKQQKIGSHATQFNRVPQKPEPQTVIPLPDKPMSKKKDGSLSRHHILTKSTLNVSTCVLNIE